MDLHAILQQRRMLFDGGTGTMLQQRGLAPGAPPELLNLSAPETVTAVHREYVEAGAEMITTNTFQAHELKLGGEHPLEEIVAAGVRCAKDAGARFVALGAGPLGQLMEPMGNVSFARAYDVYARQMRAGAAAGADLILIETLSDLYEAKAAVLAAKENTGLPVFCTMSFGEGGRTYLGCDARTAVLTLQGLGVDALGVNCSLGPVQLRPVVDEMLRYSAVPVIVQANAGLPVVADGKTVYDITPEQFADAEAAMAEQGVRILGGCCGTTPAHIRMLAQRLAALPPPVCASRGVTACTAGARSVLFGDRPVVVGAAIRHLDQAVQAEAAATGALDELTDAAIDQADEEVDVLEVFCPGVDEARLVQAVQGVAGLPLLLGGGDPAALERALRVCNGKPMLSVSAEAACLDALLPAAKKYGALLVGQTRDENGVPGDAEGRLALARRIRDAALAQGILPHDILIDCIASAAPARMRAAWEAARLVRGELGLGCVLGVGEDGCCVPVCEQYAAGLAALVVEHG